MSWLPRVLSYPPRHPYVDRLHGRAATLVHRDEPMPRLDRFYDPAWVRANAQGWDVAHLHFGHEQHPVDRVVEVALAHRRAGVPVVVTVHDLEVPHLPPDDPGPARLLTALAPVASAVLTLTPGCAAAVRALTGRPAAVVPHGPLVPAARRHRLRAHRRRRFGGGHVLVHAGTVRPNLGLEEVVAACRLQHPHLPVRIQVRDAAADRVRHAVADTPGIEVVATGHLGDALLERRVADAAALLLPYRWGSHSGLLEMAADVGTPVLHTDVGWLAEQPAARPLAVPIPVTAGRVDVTALARALAGPLPPAPPLAVHERDRAAAALVEGHRRLYRRLTATAGVAA
jgi:beta-1,4-mannosyltransferase